jgi:hypothetical protein
MALRQEPLLAVPLWKSDEGRFTLSNPSLGADRTDLPSGASQVGAVPSCAED